MARDDLPFSRDLGYLDKFLDSLRAHAGGLPEARRRELLQLVAAEAEAWDRIKALLAAESGNRASAPRGLTVGSLISGR